jgi:hypothetical protein
MDKYSFANAIYLVREYARIVRIPRDDRNARERVHVHEVLCGRGRSAVLLPRRYEHNWHHLQHLCIILRRDSIVVGLASRRIGLGFVKSDKRGHQLCNWRICRVLSTKHQTNIQCERDKSIHPYEREYGPYLMFVDHFACNFYHTFINISPISGKYPSRLSSVEKNIDFISK